MNPVKYLENKVHSLNYKKKYVLERIKIQDGKTKITVRYLDKLFYKIREEKIGTVAKWTDYMKELKLEIRQYKRAIKTLKKYGN